MQINYLGTCDLASITRKGKLNLIGIFRQIFVRQLPTNYLKFSIVAMLTGKQDSQQQLQLNITSPDNKSLLNQNINLKINQSGTANMFFDVVNLPIKQTGPHSIKIKQNNQTIAQTTLEIIKINPKSSSQTIH